MSCWSAATTGVSTASVPSTAPARRRIRGRVIPPPGARSYGGADPILGSMDEIERTYWIAFAAVRGIGRGRFQQMEDHFGSLAGAGGERGGAEISRPRRRRAACDQRGTLAHRPGGGGGTPRGARRAGAHLARRNVPPATARDLRPAARPLHPREAAAVRRVGSGGGGHP